MLAQSNRLITSVALAHAAGILLHLICFHIPLGRAGDAALPGPRHRRLLARGAWLAIASGPHEGQRWTAWATRYILARFSIFREPSQPPNLQELRRFAIQLVALTILLAVLFNVLNSVTSLEPPGSTSTPKSGRGFVAVCGVVAGVFDIDRRRHSGSGLLQAHSWHLSQMLAAGSGLNITVCRVVFPAIAGSGSSPLSLSLFICLRLLYASSQLWAEWGKVISNVVALVVTIPSAVLAQANDQALISLAFVLSAAVLIR